MKTSYIYIRPLLNVNESSYYLSRDLKNFPVIYLKYNKAKCFEKKAAPKQKF